MVKEPLSKIVNVIPPLHGLLFLMSSKGSFIGIIPEETMPWTWILHF